MPKAKTKAQLDRATDQRLRKTYGVGLDWYDCQLRIQGGGCAICHKPPTGRRLHVDHDHSWKKVKIEAKKQPLSKNWRSSAKYLGKEFVAGGTKKSLAVREIKKMLLRASVRGLLCYTHNAGLQKFQDDPEILKSAAEYLYDHSPEPTEEWCDSCDGTGLMEGWNHRDGHPCPKCKGKAVA